MSNLLNRILCFLILMLFLLLAGCADAPALKHPVNSSAADLGKEQKKEDKVKLKVFTQYSLDVDEKQPFDFAYSKMKALMPNVELNIDIQPQDDSSKLKIYAASDNLPDIIQVTLSTVDLFRKSNNLLMLDKYVKDTGIESRLLPSYRSLLWSDDGHSYAVPRTAPSTHLMFYNKELFNKNNVKVPKNFDEFLAAVKAFKAKGITPMTIFGKETWPGVMLYEDFITRYEPLGLMKIDQGKGNLTEEPYVKAAKLLQECVKAGLLSQNAFTTDYDTAFTEFTTGKAAMFINGCWALGPLGDKMGDNVDYMDFPLADTDAVLASLMNRPGGGFDGGYSVSANTKFKEIAGKYTCLLALEVADGRVIKAGAPNPLTNDGVKPEKGYPAISVKYSEQAKNYKTTTVFPWSYNSKIGVILGDNCAKLLTGNYPVEAFIKDTDNEIKETLK